MKIITLSLLLFGLLACKNKKADLVEKRRFALDGLKFDQERIETAKRLFDMHSSKMPIDTLDKIMLECALDKVNCQHLLDSCNDELSKF